ncbi:MAG: four helix bundle protein [Candidatus Omnitrophica bacterium]|nr:four helix bundle protein [Candidatus Omnitrophota bacterium]
MAHTFRSLKVWEKAHQLVLEIYRATEPFPNSETSSCPRSEIFDRGGLRALVEPH